MKRILLALALLASTSVFAQVQTVDEFLVAAKSMDELGYQILGTYRTLINKNCTREVTVLELRAFQTSAKFALISANLSMAPTIANPQVSQTYDSITCNEFIQRNAAK